jgi:phage shock protein A
LASIAKGAERGLAEVNEALQLADNGLPDALRPLIAQVLKEIEDIEEQVKGTDRSLKALTQETQWCSVCAPFPEWV